MRGERFGWIWYGCGFLTTLLLILVVLGKPAFLREPPPPPYSTNDLDLAKSAGVTISVLMGEVTLDPASCKSAREKAYLALSPVQPLVDKLAAIDERTYEIYAPQISKVTALPEGVTWIEKHCSIRSS